MSSLNVRLARKTRGKTDLLNRTNVPGSDGARHDHRAGAGAQAGAGAGLVQGGMTAEPTPARVLAVFAGTRLGGEARGPPTGLCRAGPLGRGG